MGTLSYTPLSESEIQSELSGLPNWRVVDGMLSRTFEFETYAGGVLFACGAAHAADTLNHHPDLMIGYRKVTASLTTHDSKGLTSYDFEMARRIDKLV